MKHYLFSSLAFLGLLLTLAAPVSAASTTTATVKKLPFHGKLDSFTSTSITVGKNQSVYQLDANTVIIDGAGNPASFSSAVAGESVSGSYIKNADGTKVLSKLRLGAKTGTGTSTVSTATAPAPATEPAASPAPAPTPTASMAAPTQDTTVPTATATTAKVKKHKLTGKVVSVDTAANSITIHGTTDKTYLLDPAAKVTDASGAPASLGGFAPGSKVSGTYATSADGSLTLYTLKPGK